jgi:hypothetical protein
MEVGASIKKTLFQTPVSNVGVFIVMHVMCIFILFLLQPTNARAHTHTQTYIITLLSLHIILTPTCFDTSVSSLGSSNTYLSLKMEQSVPKL